MATTTSGRPHKKISLTTVQTLAVMAFTADEIANSDRAWVTPHDGDIVYLVNGSVPAADEGHIIKSEITAEITENVPLLQIVSQTGTVNVTVELDTYT